MLSPKTELSFADILLPLYTQHISIQIMDIVLSGIRSTGKLHLGNYFGALRNFIRMQDENKCFFLLLIYIPSQRIPIRSFYTRT